MTSGHDRARSDLKRWKAAQPTNFFLQDHQLKRITSHSFEAANREAKQAHLRHLGEVVAGPLDEAAAINNRPHNLPRLDRFSGIGERIESIEHHPSYDVCGKAIYEDGRVIAAYGETQPNLTAQTAFFLTGQAGEAGHNCPVACTAGAVKIVDKVASPEIRAKYLEGLLTADYASRLSGAQFLTEVQGGSDVGANAVVATPDGEGMGTTRWRIQGEKWFCSNAAAEIILMTARVGDQPGTRGLGLFLVPRYQEDGSPNNYKMRRLKDKIGTRSMASAEIDFEGAVAYAMGPVDKGFSAMMTHVISTSRLYNTIGCAAMARRALWIARAYATSRQAFGQPIMAFPLVAEMIADMRATSNALLAGGLHLAAAFDVVEEGQASEADRGFARVIANLAKLRSCQHSHRTILTGIETLGGNGAIESFSPLPRLLRDNVVYENWEGTHNVLVAQTVRDFGRLGLHETVVSALRELLATSDAALDHALRPAFAALDRFVGAIPGLLSQQDAGLIALALRPHVEALADIFFAAAYARDIAGESNAERRSVETTTLQWFCERNLSPDPPIKDVDYAQRAAQIANMSE